MAESANIGNRRDDLDRLLLLLASGPRPGFEAQFEELTQREVARLLRPEEELEGEAGDR